MSTAPPNTERIIIVDDEPANLRLLDKLLRAQGYLDLVLVDDPREVINRYRATRPDLILLDINMPYLDGYQVMEQLKALDDPLFPPVVILTAQHSRDALLIRISDAGAGLTPEQQARLLVAFERLDADQSAVEGTGIGLALSKRLMEHMEGEIGVDSTPGSGSTFWVRLPLADHHADPRPAPPPAAEEDQPRCLKGPRHRKPLENARTFPNNCFLPVNSMV